MSSGTAAGILVIMDVEISAMILLVPVFLMIISLGDSALLLATWRSMDLKVHIKERFSWTLTMAGPILLASTLATALTYSLCAFLFSVRGLRSFALALFLARLVHSLYVISFQSTFLWIFAHMETSYRHALTCLPIPAKSISFEKNFCFQFCCTGGLDKKNPNAYEDNQEHLMVTFFRDIFSLIFLKTKWRISAVIFFFLYITLCSFSATRVRGFRENEPLLSNYFSHYNLEQWIMESNFYHHQLNKVHIIINKPMDYSSPHVQLEVLNLLGELDLRSSFVPKIFNSWLHSYLIFLQQNKDKCNRLNFVECFRDVFLKSNEGQAFVQDIKFNKDTIETSRFFIESSMFRDAERAIRSMDSSREIAQQYPNLQPVVIYNLYYPLLEEFEATKSLAVQAVGSAAFVVLLITVLFAPDFAICLMSSASVLTVFIGVIAYIAFIAEPLRLSVLVGSLGPTTTILVTASLHFSYTETVPDALTWIGTETVHICACTIFSAMALSSFPRSYLAILFSFVTVVHILIALHVIILIPMAIVALPPRLRLRILPRRSPEATHLVSDDT